MQRAARGPRGQGEGLPWRRLFSAARAAADPELAREAVRSFREEAGPPGMTWDAAIHFERSTQMWSQRRRDAP